MIKLFRGVRQKLLGENRIRKYAVYAIGEIVLLVFGIMIAVQINKWYEKKKQVERFDLAVEQVYNDIDLQLQDLLFTSALNQNAIYWIDILLDDPDSIPDVTLPHILFYLDLARDVNNLENFNANNLTSNLNLEAADSLRIKLTKEITSYTENTKWNETPINNLFTPLLNNIGLPTPNVIIGFSFFNNFSNIDKSFFTQDELAICRTFIKTNEARKLLRTLRANRTKMEVLFVRNSIADCRSVLKEIKAYKPDVRLFYVEVGIIGTSIDGYDDVGAKSTPMSLTNKAENIWELDIYLKPGTVKFRTRDSWNESWGGNSFP